MRRGIFFVAISLSMATGDSRGQDKPETPAEQYQRLLKDHRIASSPGVVLTDEERLRSSESFSAAI
jgi:hypothetical protein